ncbi:MAG: hypothetical protein JWR26_1710 [Pedosphaera sp.]|nr:hypothetical protein [Pedosphaera sp.]
MGLDLFWRWGPVSHGVKGLAVGGRSDGSGRYGRERRDRSPGSAATRPTGRRTGVLGDFAGSGRKGAADGLSRSVYRERREAV